MNLHEARMRPQPVECLSRDPVHPFATPRCGIGTSGTAEPGFVRFTAGHERPKEYESFPNADQADSD